jgi:RNA polymerase primary sigma factor
MNAHLNDEMKIYLTEVSSHKLLTREEELDLFRRHRRGDETAREAIINANLRFVLKIALQYAGRGVSISDLVQEGNLGLMDVVEKFDPEKGFRFSTYAAFWIRQSVQLALRKHVGAIKLPIRKSRLLGRLNEEVRAFTGEHGRMPQPQELALLLDTTVEVLEEIMQVSDSMISLDRPDDEATNERGLLNRLQDPLAVSSLNHAIECEQRDKVAEALATLSSRERQVLHLRYGFADGNSMSLRDASKHVGMSQEGVRRTERVALKKLRSTPQSAQLIGGLI